MLKILKTPASEDVCVCGTFSKIAHAVALLTFKYI